jgi:hypothetical protein
MSNYHKNVIRKYTNRLIDNHLKQGEDNQIYFNDDGYDEEVLGIDYSVNLTVNDDFSIKIDYYHLNDNVASRTFKRFSEALDYFKNEKHFGNLAHEVFRD